MQLQPVLNLLNAGRPLLGGGSLISFFYDPLNDKALPGTSTFTRASIAEQYDGTDFTQVGSGVIREDSVAVFGGSKGYLPEPAATNQAQESDVANWVLNFVTVNQDGVNALGLDQTTVTADTSDNFHRVALTTASGAGSAYVIAKQGTGRYICIARGSSSATAYATFDLQTGTVTETGAGINETEVTDLGDGHYKCEVYSADTGTTFGVAISNSATPGTGIPVFVGASETILFSHAQRENTIFSTSPIITSGSALTRVADVIDSGVVISEEFGALFDFTAPTVIGIGNTISLLGAATSAVDILRLDDLFNVIMDDGGTPTTIGTVATGQRFKVSYGRDATGRSGSLDGATAVTGDAPSSAHEGENFQVYSTASANQARGIGHSSTIYSARPTDTELEELSA